MHRAQLRGNCDIGAENLRVPAAGGEAGYISGLNHPPKGHGSARTPFRTGQMSAKHSEDFGRIGKDFTSTMPGLGKGS